MKDKKSLEINSIATSKKDFKKSSGQMGKNTPRPAKRMVDVMDFKRWLDDLNTGVNPTIHVNGPSAPNELAAIIVVDFGSPLTPISLTADQTQDITNRLKQLTKELYTNDVNIRVSYDTQNGIFWSAMA